MPSPTCPPSAATATRVRWWALALLATCPVVAFAQARPAVSTVVAFAGSTVGANPIKGPDGALYGVTAVGNLVTGGLVYRLQADGSKIDTLHQISANDANNPLGGLLLGSDGLLYGTTRFGPFSELNSAGTVFRIKTDGTGFTVLHKFKTSTPNAQGDSVNEDGIYPETELVEGPDGYLYGVTPLGGPNGTGVAYRMSRDGTSFAVLHAFAAVAVDASGNKVVPVTNADGVGPAGPLLVGADGFLYGTTPKGGANASGTIFRLRLDGSGFEVLRAFASLPTGSSSAVPTNADGSAPSAGLTDGQDGRVYGVAGLGGSLGYGTLFAFDPVGGVFSVLHNFDGGKGSQPTGELLLAQDGKLYGTTAAGGTDDGGKPSVFGTLFSISRDGTGFANLHNFDSKDGAYPTGQLVQLNATAVIGMTPSGGRCGRGVVFQYSTTGAVVDGITNCGQKKDGGGATGPALLLLLAAAAGLRRRLAR